MKRLRVVNPKVAAMSSNPERILHSSANKLFFYDISECKTKGKSKVGTEK